MKVKLVNLSFRLFLVIVMTCGVSVPLNDPLPSAGSEAKVKMVVQLKSSSGKEFRWIVRCSPKGGSHPHLDEVCSFLGKKNNRKFLRGGVLENCLQIFGGSARARVFGFAFGEKIDLELKRTDSCSIKQWDSLLPILRRK